MINKKFDFTEAKIAALPFAEKGKRYMVRDSSTKNLMLRVGETSKVYYLVKNISGKVIYVRLGDASNIIVKNARKALSENISEVDKGKNPNDEKRKVRQDITLKEFFDTLYFPRHCELSTKPLSQKTNQDLFRIQLARFHNIKMLNITHTDVETWHKTIGKQSIYRANRALALIRHMYNKAIAWGLPDGINPAKGVTMFNEKSRRRFLRPDEIPRFFDALKAETNPVFKNYILLSLYCGQRRNNMLSIRWDDVDFIHNVIYIADTKNNEPQIVPLASQALDLLKEMKAKSKSEWLFPSERKPGFHLTDARSSWANLLKKAEIQDFRLHDLRRTFGSYMAQRGTNETIIQRALGDKSRAAASVYMRVGLDPVRANIQGAVDEIISLSAPKNK